MGKGLVIMMRTIKLPNIGILIIVLLIISSIACFSANAGFVLENISENTEDCVEILEKINLNYRETEVLDFPITRFNVSDEGLIALGIQKPGVNYINIYSKEGDFLYGYDFESEGAFGLEWEGDNIAIYMVRGNSLITLDNKGACIKVADISDDSYNYQYSRNLLTATEKTIDGKTYLLKNPSVILDFISSSYSQFISVDENGNEIIIYDSGITFWFQPVINIAIIIIFVVVVVKIVRERKRTQRTARNY